MVDTKKGKVEDGKLLSTLLLHFYANSDEGFEFVKSFHNSPSTFDICKVTEFLQNNFLKIYPQEQK